MKSDLLRDRFRGCLVGLAVGDALGAPVEFMTADEIASTHGRVDRYLGCGWCPPGQHTDDTEIALCIARSLVEHRAVVLSDIAQRFVHWMVTDGHGIGNQTAAVLQRVEDGDDPIEASLAVWERSGRQAAGNGGVMRCAPVALFHWNQPQQLVADSRETCRLTHPDPRCELSCVAVNVAIAGLLRGDEAVANTVTSAVAGGCPLLEEAIASAKTTPPTALRVDDWDQGYTLVTTKLAFAALFAGQSFEESLIAVVNRGGDADTNGAVAAPARP